MTSSNFKRGAGRLSTDRYDFQDHLDGVNPTGFTDFRHTADQIDMVNPLIGGAQTVQSSLSGIADFIALQAGAGEGFITVGDGYDTWHQADGNINFDSSIPSLDTLLNPAFAAIIAGSNVPSAFTRVKRGGIVVIKAGTYIVKKTINIPPGISLIGEGYGTKIVNVSNLDLSVAPPVPATSTLIANISNASPMVVTVSTVISGLATGDIVNINGAVMSSPLSDTSNINGSWVVTVVSSTTFSLDNSSANGNYTSGGSVATNCPVFRIKQDLNRSINDTAINPDLFMFSRESKISNMVVADNFVENTQLGDVYYKIPQNKSTTVINYPSPLIQQEAGSNLVINQVNLIGRANFTSPGVVSQATGSAIQIDNRTQSSTGTILKIDNCFIDGFSLPIIFTAPAGGSDYFECSNNKIRAYGYYNGDASLNKNNSIIIVNDSTSKISNNTLWAESSNVQSIAYVSGNTATVPLEQARGKLLVTGNNVIVNKLSNSDVLNTFFQITTSGSIAPTYLSLMSYGNNIQDQFNVGINSAANDSLSKFTVNSSGVKFNGKVINVVNTVSTDYTVDDNILTSGSDYYIIAGASDIDILLPAASSNVGRTLIIKDGGTASESLPVSIIISGSDTIDGQSSYLLTTAYQSITIIAGTSSTWYIV